VVAVGPSVDPSRWLGIFDELMDRVAARFSRVEPRRQACKTLAQVRLWWSNTTQIYASERSLVKVGGSINDDN